MHFLQYDVFTLCDVTSRVRKVDDRRGGIFAKFRFLWSILYTKTKKTSNVKEMDMFVYGDRCFSLNNSNVFALTRHQQDANKSKTT